MAGGGRVAAAAVAVSVVAFAVSLCKKITTILKINLGKLSRYPLFINVQ